MIPVMAAPGTLKIGVSRSFYDIEHGFLLILQQLKPDKPELNNED
jgi:hypothetical protein